MNGMPKICGAIAALVTPMHEDGSIDIGSLKRLTEWVIRSGVQAVVPMGTTGESATCTLEEWSDVVGTVAATSRKRVPVFAGCGTCSTAWTVDRIKRARSLGADGALVVTPHYNRPTQEGLYRHYAAAASVGLPVILYNVPKRTGVDLLPETVHRLAALPGVVGVKETTGGFARLEDLRAATSDRPGFAILSGDDDTCCEAICRGLCDGAVSVAAGVVPRAFALMVDGALRGEEGAAGPLATLLSSLGVEPNPIPAKWCLASKGIITTDHPRLPLVKLSECHHERLRDALAAAGSAEIKSTTDAAG